MLNMFFKLYHIVVYQYDAVVIIWAWKIMREMTTCMIWIWICYLALDIVFHILYEVGVELKSPI